MDRKNIRVITLFSCLQINAPAKVPSVKANLPNCIGRTRPGVLFQILGVGLFFLQGVQGDPSLTLSEGVYRLSAGDRIRIDVIHEGDLSIEQEVDMRGEVVVPLLGKVVLGNRTLTEAQQILEEAFVTGGYLVDPQVSVLVLEHATRVFYLFGEVQNPGAKSLPPGTDSIDILQALSLGGDLSRYAKRSAISIQSNHPGRKEASVTLDLDALLRGKPDLGNPRYRIRAGDIVFVPERVF